MNSDRLRHLPNILTLLRILAVPVMVVAYYLPWGHVTSTTIFAIACITDWFDGYLARKLNVSSPLGAFLDPVADKLIVSTALVIVMPHVPYIALPVAIIIGREIVISALREWMSTVGASAHVAVSFVGKIKTTIQMLGVGFLLSTVVGKRLWIPIGGYTLIYAAAILTVWSMFNYLKASWGHFFPQKA